VWTGGKTVTCNRARVCICVCMCLCVCIRICMNVAYAGVDVARGLFEDMCACACVRACVCLFGCGCERGNWASSAHVCACVYVRERESECAQIYGFVIRV